MKPIFTSLALLACTSVYAAPSAVLNDTAELNDLSNCTGAITTTLGKTYGELSIAEQQSFQKYLGSYSTIVSIIDKNLQAGRSTAQAEAELNKTLDKNAEGSLLGKAAAYCVRENVLSAGDSIATKKANVKKAAKQIRALKKKVNTPVAKAGN